MKIPKWDELGIEIITVLERMGYDGFLPSDENSLRCILQELLKYRPSGPRYALYFLDETDTFDALGEVVLQNISSCLKISDEIYDERTVSKIAELYRRAGKLQTAGLLLITLGKTTESKSCFDAAPKMLKSAQPKSPWVVLEEQGFSESDAEEIIKCLYFFPCPKPIREVFYKRSPENKSQWEQKIKEGLGLEWLSKYLYDEEIQRLQKLVVEFSEPEPSPERPFVPGEWQREEPLPNLLLMTGGSKNIRADTVCFAFGKYELAIQWAIGYLQLDLGWFDSVEHMGFTQHQDVEKDVAMYFEFAGDYTSAISWREEHNLGSPRDLARLKFLVGDMVEAERLLRRPPSEFGAYYHGNELRVASKLSEIGKTGEETMCCRSCGAVLKRHWKLCPECQIPVDPRCKCGERIESHWPTCPACGAKQPTPGSTMDLSDASST